MEGTLPIIGLSVWVIVKIASLILLGMYIIFALVVVRQVQLMTDTVEVGFETPVRILAYLHLVLAVVIFIAALIIL
jgi:hypothetical protein